ncbi:unnamed protein product [Orchesella dallaii]|uniref:Uncharacterized protein n=1 Tax=Orchesella dallaii TaxID=48710 RepID=A0ABP1R9P4_9HEXA
MPSENSLVISQLKEITTTSQLERCGHHIIELVYELVKHLHFPERDKNFQQVALNTLFPHLAKIIQPQPEFELEKCMEMGLLEYKNDWLVFKHDVLATYIIAELIVHQDFESLSYENVLDLMFSNCFDAHLDESSFNSWNKVSCYTKPILSYRFAKTNLFKFLDLFAKTSEHVDAVSKLLTKVLPSQNIYKWIYATVNDNLVNLLKIILFKLEEDDKKCFKSEDLVVLAVNNGDVSLVDLVLKEYKKETKKDIINIKIPLLNFDYQFQRFISILNVAALKSKSSVLEYLLKLQPDNMQDLLYFCVVDTHEQNDVDERKHIITTLVGNYPSLLQKDSQLNKSPLLAPNLHVDLIIHLISLSVNVHAVDANDKNVLHLCPQYLTPQEYEHIVKELVKTQKTHIFHSRDKWQNTPLHYAVQHLELLDSTFELFSSANIDYDDVDEDNNTALMFAVKFNRSARLLDSLINAGSDDKARGQHNRTLLHFAVEFGNFNALTYFLSRGHDVNAIDKYGDNPLHLAQKLPQKTVHEIILTLVQHGVNVHANNDDKQTAVSTTNNPQKTGYQSRTKKQGVQVQIYKSIGELESTIRKWGSEIIRSNIDKLTAMTNCDSDFLQTLTSREILTELDAEELTSKRNDSSNANKLYNLLLTKEYDFKILLNVLNESNNTGAVSILTKEYITTLYNAVMNRKYAFVYYASKTAGFYSVFEHLLQTLEEGDRDEYAEKLSLVESMCSINPQLLASQHVEVYSPLHVALGSHNEQQMKLIQLLISHNADVNQRDIRGFTPLHSVVSQKIFSPHVIKIVKLLIENGADPDALNEQRLTFLNLAPGFLTPELYHELVEFLNSSGRKDSIKMLDYQNYSNLHHALLFMEPLPETLNIFKMNGIDFNGQDIQGNSLMFSAIAGGSKAEFLKTLLENGADWKITNIEQDNVIHIAAFYGNLSAVKLFISLGCDVNAKSKVSRTPLHNVLLAKKLSPSKSLPHTHEIVVELVEHGANVNAIYEQQTPLDIANDSQIKLKTKEFLKRHGAQCYKNIVKMLMEPMIRKWQTEVIRNNMSKLSTITNCNISLLQKLTSTGILTELEIDELVGSCGTSDFSIANKLYTVLLTKDYDFKILLNVLHEANQMEALRILIKDLISFIYDSVMNRKCPLVYYILNTKGYFDVLQTLMQKFEKLEKECVEKFNIVQFIRTLNPEFVASNSEMYSPLQLALMSSHYEQQMQLIQLLVAHKADVNEKDIRDFTSLHYAVGQENVSPHVIEIIKLLIENGADPDSVDKQGRTFLHWAPHYLSPELYDQLIVYFDSSGWVKSLNMLDSRNFSHLHHVVGTFEPLLSTLNVFKSNGIDFNGQDIDGDSVVFDAIEGGRNAKFLKVLFNYGADWKIQNSKQENALHLAALHGNVSALKLFISLGSDVNAKNTCGHTPLHNAFLAKKHGKYITTEHEIVVLLMNEHVDITAKDEDGKTPIDLARERHQTGNVLQETLEVLHNSRSSERNSFLVNNSRKEMLASMISDDETLD